MNHAKNFRNFLMEHNAYESFCRQIGEQRRNTFNKITTNRLNFRSIIDEALAWSTTSEGRNYWSDLNSLWNKGLENGKQYKSEYKSIW